MRSPTYLAIGVVVLGIAAVASPLAQQTAPPAAQTPPPSVPPRSNQPGGLAGALAPSTPPVEYSDALAGEGNFVVGVQPPFTCGPIDTPKPRVPVGIKEL